MKPVRICSLVLILSTVLLFSCKKEHAPVTSPASYDYVPVNTGHWVVYDVDSIVHADNDNNTDDSVRYFHFQIKEVISSTFIDGEGRPVQRIERYHKQANSDEWNITNVWTTTVTSNRVERVEDNIRYVALAFPINSTISWNRNSFNTLGEDYDTYNSFHEPIELGSFSFDSTLSVVQLDAESNDNYVEKIYFEEKYAVHVGRIYKVYQDLLKNAGQVVSGLDYTETVADYGNQPL